MNAPEERKGTSPCSGGVVVYVGIGSNLNGPVDQVTCALDELGEIPDSCCFACSRLYSSKPMGPPDQPDYVNAVAGLSTRLGAYDLLGQLQRIEDAHGRVRKAHWGPRTLDLDLLLYGEQVIDTPKLKVPHPGLHLRPFVLYPLQEIAPAALHVPGRGILNKLVEQCPEPGPALSLLGGGRR
jgi:2-amino-4-hydroxy-6-hydroxymethyldihydropteridine diphosphokinase